MRPSPVKGMAWHQFPFVDRFAASYTINNETGCWEWNKVGKCKYGGITYQSKYIYAHRAAWLHWNGKIQDGLFVLHKCDNHRCVNLNHLYLGTKKQNRQDFMKRHQRAKILLMELSNKGKEAVKNFWNKMTKRERKVFCAMRSKIQLEKNNGKGARFGTQGTRIWITNGKESAQLLKTNSIPKGWKKGRL